MPKDTSITKILVIGSGPIIIGQAAEFDYAGTQACIALKEEGYKVILVNNNPATIMTDSKHADHVYFEPLTEEALEKIIYKERPDGLLATVGGQTGLNLAFQLNKSGVLKKYGVKLLGSKIEAIQKGEDRQAFRKLMVEIGEPVPESQVVHHSNEAIQFAERIGFPVIVRPAYTLGGAGGGIAETQIDLINLVNKGLSESPIHQCLIEQSIAGFKEVEYEVIRDVENTCISICNMENVDPVGIHTGDSIVVAPSQTLTDQEYQMLRTSALKIVSELEIIGGCNVQFALDPTSSQYYLIEVNPRVSRSSALASKATGYPIASIAAKLSVGYLLREIVNPVTKTTFVSFEPALDYVVVKIPKWPFDKFPTIDRKLGTQMKATGEVMAIDRNLERAFLKGIQSLELEIDDLFLPKLANIPTDQLLKQIKQGTDERLFSIFELIRREMSVDILHEQTNIDPFFLKCFVRLIKLEQSVCKTTIDSITAKELQQYKEKGFSDSFLASEWGVTEDQVRLKRKELRITPIYKMVDTCAAEFPSYSNYYYSSYFGENEQIPSARKKVLIIGSGPIRIGQGIEFDYCSVHGVYALKEEGIETILINNNPETVSTDFSVADRLYFEPLQLESILDVMDAEGVKDVVVQLGGQTALNLAQELEQTGANLLGTSSSTIATLEDRHLFYQLLDQLQIPRVMGEMAHSPKEALQISERIGFPVLIRPSYVIGGKGMEIIQTLEELKVYLMETERSFPLLIDVFHKGKEAEIDLVSDGEEILLPVLMEHIEGTGVHSGDSMTILPAQSFTNDIKEKMISYSRKIALALKYKGLMNIQFIIEKNEVYVLEVNPRASRTVPIVSKITGIPLVQIATKILLGKYSLSNGKEMVHDQSYPFVCVKYPVFSHFALTGLDMKGGPEMKSTGEGISIGVTLKEALGKRFSVWQKNQMDHPILICRQFPQEGKILQELTRLGIAITCVSFLDMDVKNKQLLAYYNPYQTKQDQNERMNAMQKRIPIFTEEESLLAFLYSLARNSWEVKSIEDWHKLIRKGVNL
ncbi:carbamoyl phosphate synthase large subunit [Cytobacillus spongiae]|uniref:carbamoyl phosphate synthase large subunit n=1 Tax=Cytobacillus spongiae TaxID=2901381 RepID=UPI001F15A393|nr:carbamoyl phosphate synthase large subunit [Cytobacillus spongiae]UII56993.1 carbamoyl phosphate synthase large subunit [Cytobacillus spongiae]